MIIYINVNFNGLINQCLLDLFDLVDRCFRENLLYFFSTTSGSFSPSGTFSLYAFIASF